MTVFYKGKNKITVTDHASSKDNPNMEVKAKLPFEVKKLSPLKNFLGKLSLFSQRNQSLSTKALRNC